MAQQAHAIVEAMHATGVKRLVFISSMGIYGEMPGERYRSVLDPWRIRISRFDDESAPCSACEA
jgi:nucleoside-diphosphate-sugar epimerase